MWQDEEDNNPYGSLDDGPTSPGGFYNRPGTPPSGSSSPRDSPEFISHPRDQQSLSDVDVHGSGHIEPKKGGYDSRIEQILYENPDLEILITFAGRNSEGGGNYTAYTIRTGDLEVRRRYSDFDKLRSTLVRLHPTLIIPPIPDKHSAVDYATRPTKAKEDPAVIELRKRMLAVFLNRCRRMKDIREDGVWWRFLDPNASWTEVMNSALVQQIPQQILRAPPLDAANPKPGHAWLPIPSQSAKLRSGSQTTASGTPVSPPGNASMPSAAAHTTPGPQFARFPPTSQSLSEEQLDPYFTQFESSSKELETLLQGSMEKSNRRLLSHYANLAEDLAELGARYNSFSLSEQSPTLATAIEKTGQAVDQTYIATTDFSGQLSAQFAEPMRESAQFAGVVRSVLRYRILKRVQEQMAIDQLEEKRQLLTKLREQEEQSARMGATLSNYASTSPTKSRTPRSSSEQQRREDDVASIDSDFPPTRGDASPPSAGQGEPSAPGSNHKKTTSGNFLIKNLSRVTHAFQGVMDSDPVRTRQDLIGKTSEQVKQLEQAVVVSHDDVKDASTGVLKDLKRFQGEKEEDLKRYMVAFAKCHIEWARRNQANWEEAKAEVENIEIPENAIASVESEEIWAEMMRLMGFMSFGAAPITQTAPNNHLPDDDLSEWENVNANAFMRGGGGEGAEDDGERAGDESAAHHTTPRRRFGALFRRRDSAREHVSEGDADDERTRGTSVETRPSADGFAFPYERYYRSSGATASQGGQGSRRQDGSDASDLDCPTVNGRTSLPARLSRTRENRRRNAPARTVRAVTPEPYNFTAAQELTALSTPPTSPPGVNGSAENDTVTDPRAADQRFESSAQIRLEYLERGNLSTLRSAFPHGFWGTEEAKEPPSPSTEAGEDVPFRDLMPLETLRRFREWGTDLDTYNQKKLRKLTGDPRPVKEYTDNDYAEVFGEKDLRGGHRRPYRWIRWVPPCDDQSGFWESLSDSREIEKAIEDEENRFDAIDSLAEDQKLFEPSHRAEDFYINCVQRKVLWKEMLNDEPGLRPGPGQRLIGDVVPAELARDRLEKTGKFFDPRYLNGVRLDHAQDRAHIFKDRYEKILADKLGVWPDKFTQRSSANDQHVYRVEYEAAVEDWPDEAQNGQARAQGARIQELRAEEAHAEQPYAVNSRNEQTHAEEAHAEGSHNARPRAEENQGSVPQRRPPRVPSRYNNTYYRGYEETSGALRRIPVPTWRDPTVNREQQEGPHRGQSSTGGLDGILRQPRWSPQRFNAKTNQAQNEEFSEALRRMPSRYGPPVKRKPKADLGERMDGTWLHADAARKPRKILCERLGWSSAVGQNQDESPPTTPPLRPQGDLSSYYKGYKNCPGCPEKVSAVAWNSHQCANIDTGRQMTFDELLSHFNPHDNKTAEYVARSRAEVLTVRDDSTGEPLIPAGRPGAVYQQNQENTRQSVQGWAQDMLENSAGEQLPVTGGTGLAYPHNLAVCDDDTGPPLTPAPPLDQMYQQNQENTWRPIQGWVPEIPDSFPLPRTSEDWSTGLTSHPNQPHMRRLNQVDMQQPVETSTDPPQSDRTDYRRPPAINREASQHMAEQRFPNAEPQNLEYAYNETTRRAPVITSYPFTHSQNMQHNMAGQQSMPAGPSGIVYHHNQMDAQRAARATRNRPLARQENHNRRIQQEAAPFDARLRPVIGDDSVDEEMIRWEVERDIERQRHSLDLQRRGVDVDRQLRFQAAAHEAYLQRRLHDHLRREARARQRRRDNQARANFWDLHRERAELSARRCNEMEASRGRDRTGGQSYPAGYRPADDDETSNPSGCALM